MAIQLIIAKELGQAVNENPYQGSYFIDYLTDLVEEAVLEEFDRLDERGGVLGAMERQYQRMKIQEESMYYEHRKHSGDLPIIGINTYVDDSKGDEEASSVELRRASADEKQAQIDSVRAFQAQHSESAAALQRLQQVALAGGNIFAELMNRSGGEFGPDLKCLYAVGGGTDAICSVRNRYLGLLRFDSVVCRTIRMVFCGRKHLGPPKSCVQVV